MIKLFSSVEEASIAIPKGGLKLLIINGKKIALAHTNNGFTAFDNLCPHQHEPLDKGSINFHDQVVCRLHHYRFSLKTGLEVNNRCGAMIMYRVIENESGIYIDL